MADDNHYTGFPLSNYNDKNFYKEIFSVEECQILCDITFGCNFFIYDRQQTACFLKYGLGTREKKIDVKFGFKSCQGDYI